ncbi:MAG: response regulator [Deltaproteobacteria bacterium]|nr:response regulator [Deltaproteobacteria bacterium]MCL4874379.1 response regulator [bacterium]
MADPDASRCLKLATMVKRLDYNVFLASNGSDLVRITSGIIPNAVLLDLDMPPISGQPCLEALRSNRSLSIIKRITTSEVGRTTDLLASLSRGASGYVTRPVSPTELYRTIQKLIEPRPRNFLRIRVLFKATVITGATGRATFATALSEQGVFIRTLKPFAEGTKVRVSLELPTPKPLVLDGEVLYAVKEMPDKLSEPGMGIRFVGLDPNIQAGLHKFIEDQVIGEGGEGLL